jgi:uncharacterized protein (TIGR02996 family)
MVTALDFLRSIADDPSDDTNRLVFADWLEESGDWRAEFVRLDCVLKRLREGDDVPAETLERWTELRTRMPVGWLRVLGREPIEGCDVYFKYRCPLKWEKLRATRVASERFCEECSRKVYRCDTIEEARQHARMGNCVAVDAGVVRWPLDLVEDDTEMLLGDLAFDE